MRLPNSWLPCQVTDLCGGRPDRLHLVEDGRRHGLLGAERHTALAGRAHDRDLVVRSVEADVRARDVVDDDGVEALALELRPPALDGALAVLGREADQGLPA